ncbi:MAG: hypothetical protein R6V04_07280 [bacterium]
MNRNRALFFFFITLIIISSNCTASDNTFYVSPGLRIGWDFGRGPTISLKFSFGINTNYNTTSNFGGNTKYYNITFGFKAPLFRRAKYHYEEYNFIGLQAGCTPITDNLLFFGGGLGFMFYKNSHKTKFHPMVTVDFGLLIFGAFDLIFLENKRISTDFGFLAVVPIPWVKR